jgi:hypothetical protein
MNRGFSLIEFVAASTIFVAVILGGYEFLDREVHLHHRMLALTRPEAELNYRMLLIRSFFKDTTRMFQADTFLSPAPAVFADLQFGQSPEDQALSVACAAGSPERFVREGTRARLSAARPIKAWSILLIAGCDASGAYCWNYERVTTAEIVGPDQYLETASLTDHDGPEIGTLIPVEMHGLVFRDGHLYWIQPSGEWSPFVDLNDFRAVIGPRTVRIHWQRGELRSDFQVPL